MVTLVVKKENGRAISIYKKNGFVIINENANQEYIMQYERSS